jgi:hypothetical protein
MDRSADRPDPARDNAPASPSPARVTLERWVTPEEADADLLRLAELN